MSKITSSVTSTLFFRVGRTNKIETLFKENRIEFGCAANWIDYTIRHHDNQTGDIFEGVFAHTIKCDSRVEEYSKEFGSNLIIMDHPDGRCCLLRFMPTILIPVLCVFSFNFEKVREAVTEKGEECEGVSYALDRYLRKMRYKPDEASYLFITDKEMFVQDLKTNLPVAVDENKKNLTSDRFFGRFHPKKPLLMKDIDYSRHTKTSLFFDDPRSFEDIFWKIPEYSYQNEVRFIVPGINFIQPYDSLSGYDPSKNVLSVRLPHLKEYAFIRPASIAKELYFDSFNDEDKTVRFSVLSAVK